MSTIQRYILMELLRVFALIVTVLTVLMVFVGAFAEARARGLGLIQTAQILPYVPPSLLPYTVPATLLMTVCIVYGRLGADFEITAAKAAGISVLSLLAPAFLLSGVLSIFTLLLCDQVIPWSVSSIQRVATLAMEDIVLDMLGSQGSIIIKDRGMAITVTRVDKAERRLVKPNIRYSPSGPNKAVVMQADEATVRFDVEKQMAIIRPKNAWVDAPGEISLKLVDQEFAFPIPAIFNNEVRSRHLNLEEIQRQLVELESQMQTTDEQRAIAAAFAMTVGSFDDFSDQRFQQFEQQIKSKQAVMNKHRTELHNRFALSCSCFFFVLLGSPFAVLQARGQFLTNFFLCFSPILVCYYPIVLLMMNLSMTGQVNPVWAMWVGNLLLLVASGLVLRKAIQH